MESPFDGSGEQAPLTYLELLRQYRALQLERYTLLEAFAQARTGGLPTADDLAEMIHARYMDKQVLELLLASYDPQGDLFPDWHEES